VSWAPDFAEPIQGWRLWIAIPTEGGLRLRSVVYRTLWPAGEALVARCLRRHLFPLPRRRPAHDVPKLECRCGIYAAGLEELRPFLGSGPWSTVARVLGQVSLWGSVIECERGWRASYAYPSRLFVPMPEERCRLAMSAEEIALELADYGVPIELLPRGASSALEALGERAAA